MLSGFSVYSFWTGEVLTLTGDASAQRGEKNPVLQFQVTCELDLASHKKEIHLSVHIFMEDLNQLGAKQFGIQDCGLFADFCPQETNLS